MDDDAQRRLCDGLTGGAGAAGLAALIAGAWLGAVLALVVAVSAQVIRAAIDS